MTPISIADYDYDLPEEKIAKFPLESRQLSKLLLYKESANKDAEIKDSVFEQVGDYLNAGDVLVFNNTKVIYARLVFLKSTGAQIEIFCLEPAMPKDYESNFASRGQCEWKCMVGNLKKWKEETLQLSFPYQSHTLTLKASKIAVETSGEVVVRFEWDGEISFSEILEACGKIPIPPYLKRESGEEDRERYQTVYSKEEGSVAAPTAGLHFTDKILRQLSEQRIILEELTLHVGAGTFKPVKTTDATLHEMHTEHIAVHRELVEKLLSNAVNSIVAVGTTSVRSLESLYWMCVKLMEGRTDFYSLGQWEAYGLPDNYTFEQAFTALRNWFNSSETRILKAETTIMIVPGYKFRVVDKFFTNFHQPKSTLLLLVSAAIDDDWRKVYAHALENNYRFLSYGDGSLLEIHVDSKIPKTK
ncbi:MAG: S-adenosylmethionine:tRNA ribosyltransferase-isomerase [Culturomica sp.]|jgi:S-adenosylmethionine:tRNA ribosyltransferase-isomerase|nr:S-adenosylmethionine:tRNA ribosyltransferase-isomerase [Culturomica sp.]